MTKDFIKELNKFHALIKNKINFSLIRFGDGEGCVVVNKSYWAPGEWRHTIGGKKDEKFRKELIESLEYKDKNYYIGMPCRQSHQKRFHYLFKKIKDMTNIPEEQLTFSTVFIHYNWDSFLKKVVPDCTSRECYLISSAIGCNIKTIKEKWLQFKGHFNIPKENAHFYCKSIYTKIKNHIDKRNTKNAVFLFASGLASNVIIYNLWKYNKNNTYIDIGSPLDPFIFKERKCKGFSRIYIRKKGEGYTPCKWG